VSNEKSAERTLVKWQVGYKFECIEPVEMTAFNVATVVQVLAHIIVTHLYFGAQVLADGWLQIAFDGAAPGDDVFPVHMRSPYIFPAGFCSAHSLTLMPPRGAATDRFVWHEYLTQTKSLAAPAELFEVRVARQSTHVCVCEGGQWST
jgi:hypothetical protein